MYKISWYLYIPKCGDTLFIEKNYDYKKSKKSERSES